VGAEIRETMTVADVASQSLGSQVSSTSTRGTVLISAPFSTGSSTKSILRRETESARTAYFEDWFVSCVALGGYPFLYFVQPPSPAQPDQFFNIFGWRTERRASHMRLRQWSVLRPDRARGHGDCTKLAGKAWAAIQEICPNPRSGGASFREILLHFGLAG
jgi:hypothetical protein